MIVGDQADIVRVGALTHDVGKIEQDVRGDQWVHTSHSVKYLNDLLDDQRFRLLMQDNGINPDVNRDILLKIAEEHHSCCPSLLVKCKSTVLVSIADVIASCLETGFIGSIESLLASNPYTQINMELTRSLGFTGGLSGRIHRIDLPAHSVEDVLLANMVYQQLAPELTQRNVDILLQKRGTIWVIGDESRVREALACFVVTPKVLYEASFDETIFDAILSGLPPAGALPIDSVKYLLVNEAIAIKLAIGLYGRKSIRGILERYNLSDMVEQAAQVFKDGLETGIEFLWQRVRERLEEESLRLPIRILPVDTNRGQKLSECLTDVEGLDKKTQKDLEELLRLFDCSTNKYRSLTNIVLELRGIEKEIKSGAYKLSVAEFATLNGSFITDRRHSPRNKSLCPICRSFPQQIQAQALITGKPKTDSIFQTFRNTYSSIRICRWCFIAGYMDLPIAKITKKGQNIGKHREYLLINSSLAGKWLQRLIDFVAQVDPEEFEEEDLEEEDNETIDVHEQEAEKAVMLQEMEDIQALIGNDVGADMLSVYGLSQKRLSQLKGFALPTLNRINSIVGVRVPVERLAGEEGVTGAVKRELIKATMYDFYRLTGGSLHYVTPTDYQFSVFGEEVTLEEMYRSSLAYRIADAHARTFSKTKKSHVLNQGLFLELLSNPRHAVTLIWRKKYRDSFPPGAEKVKEVIELSEQIAVQDDWKWQLGLEIVGLLVENGWCPRAKGFWKSKQEQYTGVELVKWIQSIKMVRDPNSARSWGTRLLNGYRREHEQGANQELVTQVLELVEKIITTCEEKGCLLRDFSRSIANMDLYLLFHHNHFKGGESE